MLLPDIPSKHTITPLPRRLTASATGLSPSDHKTLLKKKKWLETYSVVTPRGLTRTTDEDAVLVFAQEEAGTAVCISSRGMLLTCSHCVAESREELDWDKTHWLLFASGRAVAARTVVWDGRRDLAVLFITSATETTFPYAALAREPPRLKTRILCVGHPGSEDLEASMPCVQTNYDTLVLTTGLFLGLAEGQDPQSNEDIGALMHDCWTYWGHSGAPLLDQSDGRLVGMHSSWDDETGMRRGIPWEAIMAFLDETGVLKEEG